MTTSSPSPTNSPFIEPLLSLGFSQYEARCYVGLLGPGSQTGYAVAKTTGVPQPKVYEALRKLVTRGAARQLTGEPVLFVATPPDQLLDGLQDAFHDRLERARTVSTQLEVAAVPRAQEAVARLTDRAEVLEAAAAMIDAGVRRIYLSATSPELASLRGPVTSCARRGVDVVVLCLGDMPFKARGVRVFRHASTDGAVFRHHQSRHLALVADSRCTVMGLASDGKNWAGVETDSGPLVAAVKGYIRHDIDLQKVFADFSTELLGAYGPGLQQLESYRAEVPPSATVSGAGVPEVLAG